MRTATARRGVESFHRADRSGPARAAEIPGLLAQAGPA
jgi:hypothetical protein